MDKNERAAKPPYFVSATELGAPSPPAWAETKAKKLDGAKRLAAKLPRRLTTMASVAVKNAQGEFETIATLCDYSAITRRRPMWKTHQLTTEQASA